MNETPREGRPRAYDLPLPDGFASADIAAMYAMIEELSERAFDLAVDLTPDELAAKPGGSLNSIHMLISHMIWADVKRYAEATGEAIPDWAETALPAEPFGTIGQTAAQLVEFGRRARDEFVKPALAKVADADAPIDGFPGMQRATVRGLMVHLTWHWNYHGGQVGLLRRMVGRPYRWTFDRTMTGRPPA